MADVAIAAERIVGECVVGEKYSVGGRTDVGNGEGSFYVGLGGLVKEEGGRGGG